MSDFPRPKARLALAYARFDALNAQDPTRSRTPDGQEIPHELHYGRRMTHWLAHLYPHAPEPLRLAARCQHIRRWDIPRSSFPADRDGYLTWRKRLYDYHGEVADPILAGIGYDRDTIARVRSLLRKERLKADPDAQALEDTIAMVFLENEFADFLAEHAHEPDKVIKILRRTWAKMSPVGHAAALAMDFPPDQKAMIQQALDA